MGESSSQESTTDPYHHGGHPADRYLTGVLETMAYPLHRAPSSAADAHPGAAFGVPASPDLPAIEREVLAYWEADDTFRASVERNPAGENG
ncbi:MAG: hypothetical protein ACTH2O_14815, partial [Cellulosimicrobium funkei]